MHHLINAALRYRLTVVLSFVLVLFAGTSAYLTTPKDAFPEITVPYFYIPVFYQGISPQDSERLLIRPLEVHFRAEEGLKEMTATAFEGGGLLFLEFEAGLDTDTVLQDLRATLDSARVDLPDGVDEPVVQEISFSEFPTIVINLWGDVPLRTLKATADRLEEAIEALPQVLRADISGDREEVVDVEIDPNLLQSYNIMPDEAIAFVSRSNRLVAAGNMDTGRGRFAIKVPGLFETVEDILALPIKVEGNAVVRVADVARVKRTFKDPDSFARFNGKPSLSIEVVKRAGENIIVTNQAVREIVENFEAGFPPTLNATISQDMSDNVRQMVGDLENNVIAAVLLIMVVIVAALGLRSAILVGLAIPGSFLLGILVLSAGGLTMNFIVLYALILSVGMLVDGAIVVAELADRKMAEGLTPPEAYGVAARRMVWPIIASTATTLAAFLPLAFWPGLMGEFMKFLPMTVMAVLSASLIMAMIFLPVLGSLFGKASAVDAARARALAASETGDLGELTGITARYVGALNRVLDHPGKVVASAFALLIVMFVAYGMFGKGVELFPDTETEEVHVLVHARGNLSVFEQDALVNQVERRIAGIAGFETFYTRTRQSSGADDQFAPDVIGIISIELADWDKRARIPELFAEVHERTSDLAGIQVETRKPEEGPPTGKPIQVELAGRDFDTIHEAVRRVRDKLESMDGLTAIEDDRPLPGIEWEITVDRARAATYGIDVTAVGDAIRLVTNGVLLSAFRPDNTDDEVDIQIRYPLAARSLDALDQVRVETPQGSVPISNFVTRTAGPKVSEIRRVDGARVNTVKADVVEGVLAADKLVEIRQWLASEQPLPAGISYSFGGEDEEARKAQAFLSQAFLIALFIMAIILVTQFNSLYDAVLILSAVVLSTIGVLFGLILLQEPFGIVMTGIGVIALAGIVVNNNIVLIDTFEHLAEKSGDTREAILRTCAQRLRPVALTTITTILGLMPMALKLNLDFINREISYGAPSSEFWADLSRAVVFGLSFATILTLIVTPSALMMRANVQSWGHGMLERLRRRKQAQAAGD